MPVNKKYLKIGVACLAVSALVIGLSVGLTQKNKNNNNAASSNAAYDTYDIDSAEYEEVCYGKSGKSGGGSGKSGKSGGFSIEMSYGEGKSGKSGNRALYVPGILEAYGDDTDASTGKRRKLRHQLLGKLLFCCYSPSYAMFRMPYNVGCSSSIVHRPPRIHHQLSHTLRSFVSTLLESIYSTILCENTERELAPPPTTLAPPGTKSGKSSGDGSTKSGKSGVSSQCWYEDVCDGYGSSGKSGKSGSGYGSGKSGKSGGESDSAYGSSGKSGKGSSGCGKSGKSGGGSGDDCPASPTVSLTCEPGVPPPELTETFSTPPIIPADCICEEQPWVWDGAMCVRSCDLTGPGSPSATECCEENTASPDCPINDCGLIPTPSPTEGGTTTVATEKTSAPTQGDRGGV